MWKDLYYDRSQDYWLLKRDGTIVDDGSKDFNVEYLDADGNVRIAKEVIKARSGSWSQSLFDVLGEDQALSLLADRDIDTTDMTTQQIREALYTSSGYEWSSDVNQWVATSDDASLSFAASEAMTNRYIQDATLSWGTLSEGLQGTFAGGLSKYAQLLPYYMAIPEVAASGTPAAWLNDNIVEHEFFGGYSGYMHQSVADALDNAQRDYDIGFDFNPIESFNGAFNPRFIGGTNNLSMHAFGLAIDVNASQNGMIRESNSQVMEAIWLMNGYEYDEIPSNTAGMEPLIYSPQQWVDFSNNFEQMGDAQWREDFASGFESNFQTLTQYGEYLPSSVASSLSSYVEENTALYSFLENENNSLALNNPSPANGGNLGWFAQQGFANHDSVFVNNMLDHGFDWLMIQPSIYDSMHFEIPGVITYVY